jgi:hypothetical protein
MSVRNPRTRLISFRLSEDEYQALQSLCDAHEARSLSEFVRTSICWISYNADQLPAGFFRLHLAGMALRSVVESETLSLEPGGDGMGDRLASAVVHLNRRTDALDREIRRLGMLLRR